MVLEAKRLGGNDSGVGGGVAPLYLRCPATLKPLSSSSLGGGGIVLGRND